MEKFEIAAEKRSVVGKQVKALRREGKLPGVIYGHGMDPIAIVMDMKESTKVLNKATTSSIISINIGGKELSALIRETQLDYLKNRFIHADFQSVSLTEKIRAEVEVELDGIAPAIKDFSGVMVEGLTQVEVEALPKDLPERFIVDISTLGQIGDMIQVKDLQIPQGVEVLSSLDEMIVLITAPEAEEVETVEETAALEPELIEKAKKEEEEKED